MGNKKDVVGEVYNRFTIVEMLTDKIYGKHSYKYVRAQCSCGNFRDVCYKDLTKNRRKSCGCINEEAKTKVNIGDTFNHWTLIEEIKPFVEERRYLVRCVCGQERIRGLSDVYRGATKSCGCRGKIKVPKEEKLKLMPENTKEEMWKQSINHPQYYVSTLGRLFHFKAQVYTSRKRLHEGRDGYKSVHILKEMYWLFIGGYDETTHTLHLIGEEIKLENLKLKEDKTKRYRKLRTVYSNIKVRCYNKNSKDYKNYGERGIIVEESFNTFDKFFNWAVSNGYKEGLEIDRKNNNSNYSEINCRWVTKAENTRNRRASVMTWKLVDDIRFGIYENMTIQEIANILNCSWSTIKAVRNFKTWIK